MPATFARLCASVAIVFASTAFSEEPHYDVFVTSQNGALVIGGYDDTAITALVPPDQMLVFGGEVIPTGTSSSPYESANPGEPGFRGAVQSFLDNPALTTPSGTYSALPGSIPLTFDFLPFSINAASRNLFYWNGLGPVSFTPVGSDVSLTLTKQGAGGWSRAITGSSNLVVGGDTIQVTGSGASAGSVHTHLYTAIDREGTAPDHGFYLFSLKLRMTGLTDSAQLYFVYGALDPTALSPEQFTDFELAHGAAETWVQNNLAVVPEPSVGLAALLAAAGGGVFLVRRRGRTSDFFRASRRAG